MGTIFIFLLPCVIGSMLSLHFPTALLKLGPVLSHCLAKAGGCALALFSPSASLNPTGMHGPQRGALFDHLALMARETYVPGCYGTVMTGETILVRLPFPGHCTGSRLKHIFSPSMEKGYFLS